MDEIKTDADRLIEALSSAPAGRSFSISELRARTGLPSARIKHWARALQSQGRVRLSYNLGREYVSWLGSSRPLSMVSRSPVSLAARPSASAPRPPPSDSAASSGRPPPAPAAAPSPLSESDLSPPVPRPGPEPRPSARPPSEPPAPLVYRTESSAAMALERHTVVDNATLPALGQSVERLSLHSERALALPAEPGPVSFSAPDLPALPSAPLPDLALNERLRALLRRIQSQSERVEALKARKQGLLSRTLLPLERRLEAQMDSISERLLQHEQRLLAVRQRVSDLPGEVSKAAEQHAQLSQVSAEMQKAYDETAHLLDESTRSIAEAREASQGHVERIRSGMMQQAQQIGNLRHAINELSTLQAEAEARLGDARRALEEEQARFNQVQGLLAGVGAMKAGMESEMEEADGRMRQQKRDLEQLDAHLARMGRVQEWVAQHRALYDRRMRQLADYIAGAESDYRSLRESVEGGFAKRYLQDLRALSESYSMELAQAQSVEGDIDRQVEQAKAELAALIKQADTVARLQELKLEEIGPVYRQTSARALNRDRLFRSFEQSAEERARIRRSIAEAVGLDAGSVPSDGAGSASSRRPKPSAPRAPRASRARRAPASKRGRSSPAPASRAPKRRR